MISKLLKIISSFEKFPKRTIEKDKELVKWINEHCGDLKDSKYSLKTKCYWVIHGIVSWDDKRVCCSNPSCNKPLLYNIKTFRNGYNGLHCSSRCAQLDPKTKEKQIKTLEAKYGVGITNVYQADEVKEKIKKTCLEKYGVEYITQSDKMKLKAQKTFKIHCDEDKMFKERIFEKYKKSCIEKYGVENPSQSSEIKKKKLETFQKHCEEIPDFKNLIKEKQKITSLMHYNVEFPSQNKEIKEKTKKTCLERYGVEFPMQDQNILEKSKQTCISHFGVERPSQSPIIRSKQLRKYFYKGMWFDSSWEIVFYEYLSANNINFEYQPNISFEYKDINYNTHHYIPDFKIIDTNEIIELKGDNNFAEDGKMINPKKRNYETDFLYEAKYQCMLKNNVKIYRYKEMIPYFNWFDKKFGNYKKFLKQFKTKKPD